MLIALVVLVQLTAYPPSLVCFFGEGGGVVSGTFGKYNCCRKHFLLNSIWRSLLWEYGSLLCSVKRFSSLSILAHLIQCVTAARNGEGLNGVNR